MAILRLGLALGWAELGWVYLAWISLRDPGGLGGAFYGVFRWLCFCEGMEVSRGFGGADLAGFEGVFERL